MNWLIGLGNPGMVYRRTRHNVGFMVVDAFARTCGGAARERKTRSMHQLELRCGELTVMAVKPKLYMNRSGTAVGTLPLDRKRDRLLVVHDDASLEFGQLRLRVGGSAGGQKGMADIIAALGTQEIPRLKVGIGRDPDMPLEDYVLQPFSGVERRELPDVIERAAEAVRLFFEEGIDTAMNRYNRKPQPE